MVLELEFSVAMVLVTEIKRNFTNKPTPETRELGILDEGIFVSFYVWKTEYVFTFVA